MYENSGQFEKVFQKCAEPFSGVFLIYDVDHNDEDDINKMFKKYNDETDEGLLLLNSPCFETITGSHELIYNKEIGHLTEYKTELNKSFSEKHNCSACEFIKNNF